MHIELDFSTAPLWLIWLVLILYAVKGVLGIVSRRLKIKIRRIELKKATER